MSHHERRQPVLVPSANLDEARKGDPVYQLHRKLRATAENSRVRYLNDVGVLEPGPNPRFLRKALEEFLFLVFRMPKKRSSLNYREIGQHQVEQDRVDRSRCYASSFMLVDPALLVVRSPSCRVTAPLISVVEFERPLAFKDFYAAS